MYNVETSDRWVVATQNCSVLLTFSIHFNLEGSWKRKIVKILISFTQLLIKNIYRTSTLESFNTQTTAVHLKNEVLLHTTKSNTSLTSTDLEKHLFGNCSRKKIHQLTPKYILSISTVKCGEKVSLLCNIKNFIFF